MKILSAIFIAALCFIAFTLFQGEQESRVRTVVYSLCVEQASFSLQQKLNKHVKIDEVKIRKHPKIKKFKARTRILNKTLVFLLNPLRFNSYIYFLLRQNITAAYLALISTPDPATLGLRGPPIRF